MTTEKEEEKTLQPHHEQLPLCTTRLPYRQGRKLTAVKTYTVNNESAHLLIFGVPSLNLRREARELFIKFGRLIKFNLVKDYAVEDFTETYHAHYDRIQSARLAKKMLDTRSFYGGSLHVCYAPELETVEETKNKLLQRKKDVLFRLRNLKKEATETTLQEQSVENVNRNRDIELNSIKESNTLPLIEKSPQIGPMLDAKETPFARTEIINEIETNGEDSFENNTFNTNKLNMGETNLIYLNKGENTKKRRKKEIAAEKRFKKSFEQLSNAESSVKNGIVDCTSTEKEVVSNINEALNFNKFGNEIIRTVVQKPLNKIVFNVNKKSL